MHYIFIAQRTLIHRNTHIICKQINLRKTRLHCTRPIQTFLKRSSPREGKIPSFLKLRMCPALPWFYITTILHVSRSRSDEWPLCIVYYVRPNDSSLVRLCVNICIMHCEYKWSRKELNFESFSVASISFQHYFSPSLYNYLEKRRC